MAKHLKQNEISYGSTIFVVHPKFKSVEVRFVLDKPRPYNLGGVIKHKTARYKYVPIAYFKNLQGDLEKTFESEFLRNLLGVTHKVEPRHGFCGDDGIPNAQGKFEYRQERRTFRSLKEAVKFWNECQTPENCARWKEEDESFRNWDF